MPPSSYWQYEMTFSLIKGRKLHYVVTHNVIWANQKIKSSVYRWLCAKFNVTCFLTFIRASDVISSVLWIRKFKVRVELPDWGVFFLTNTDRSNFVENFLTNLCVRQDKWELKTTPYHKLQGWWNEYMVFLILMWQLTYRQPTLLSWSL